MKYTLKHCDTPLLVFSAEAGANPDIKILWLNTEKASLLPLELSAATASDLESWIKHRSIPKNRAYVDTILSSMGLSSNRPMDVIRVSKGLSLNDCYWVVQEGFSGTFAQNNLYDNRFSRILGQIAFTGYGSSDVNGLSSSPEFTTNGMLPKCWRRVNGKIMLYKGGTQGASNTGFEPYSEFYAAQIGQLLGVTVIPYSLSMWKNTLCSTCELFTSKEVSFVPVGKIVRKGGMPAVKAFYASLGSEFTKALNDMIVLDALIYNVDRHYGNFGFLVNSATNKIIAPAPLFDHGNSLLNYAGQDALRNEASIEKYARTLLPAVYDDFVTEAKSVMTHEHRNNLRKLLDVRLKRHSRYNLAPDRLKLVEHILHKRAAELLDD